MMRSLLLASLALSFCALPLACAPAVDLSADGGMLWDTPAVPGPVALFFDDAPVHAQALHEFLTSEWTQFYLRQEGAADQQGEAHLAAVTQLFYAQPIELLRPLIHDLLLVREHAQRFPEVDGEHFGEMQAAFHKGAGETARMLEEHLGKDGVRAHLLRRFRLEETLLEMRAGLQHPTEAEIQAWYDGKMQLMRESGEYSDDDWANRPTLDDHRVRELAENQLMRQQIEVMASARVARLWKESVITFVGLDGQKVPLRLTSID
ncbi:MAG: hypothetical protein HN405_02230 [Planctomycetes bacterium]|nr:hypothetical protein [Planctomycetota bacterium]MBT7318013.1 hypothetical protein [Planctomycetota bacterium]